MHLQEFETQLTGNWIFEGGVMKEDEVATRIKWLVTNSLKMIRNNNTGWEILYQDTIDGRYWELTYRNSDMQGGGPPSLIHLSETEAKLKYEQA